MLPPNVFERKLSEEVTARKFKHTCWLVLYGKREVKYYVNGTHRENLIQYNTNIC